MKKLLYLALGIIIASAGSVYAVNISVPQSTAVNKILVGMTGGLWANSDMKTVNGNSLIGSGNITIAVNYSTTSAEYWLTTKSTTNLSEGTNLYYTTTRFLTDFYSSIASSTPNWAGTWRTLTPQTLLTQGYNAIFNTATTTNLEVTNESKVGTVKSGLWNGSTVTTNYGGIGTTSPSGILYGDNGATTHLNSINLGTGLKWDQLNGILFTNVNYNLSYYLYSTMSTSSPVYNVMNTIASTTQTINTTNNISNGQIIRNWISPVNSPNKTVLPIGIYEIEIYASASEGGNSQGNIYYQVWETNSSGVNIGLIGTTESTSLHGGLISSPVSYSLSFSSIAPYTLASSNSRIVLRQIGEKTGAGTLNILTYVGDGSDSHFSMPVANIDTSLFASLSLPNIFTALNTFAGATSTKHTIDTAWLTGLSGLLSSNASDGQVVNATSANVISTLGYTPMNKATTTLDLTRFSSTNASTTISTDITNFITNLYLPSLTSKLLRTDATGKVSETTVGTGLTFDGTTLASSITQYTDALVNDYIHGSSTIPKKYTANTYTLTQTDTLAPIFSSLTGVLKGNGASALTVASNGTDFTLVTAKTCGAGESMTALTAGGVATCTAVSVSTTTLANNNTWSGTNRFTGSTYVSGLWNQNTDSQMLTTTGYFVGDAIQITSTATSTIRNASTTNLTVRGNFDLWGTVWTSVTQMYESVIAYLQSRSNTWTGRNDFSNAVVVQHLYSGLPAIATTTSWTATSTRKYFGTAYRAQTWNSIDCYTVGGGFLNVQVYNGETMMNMVKASGTVSRFDLTTNNIYATSSTMSWSAGTTTTSLSTAVSCTVDRTIY